MNLYLIKPTSDKNGRNLDRLFIVLLLSFSFIYIFNIDGWLMHDDEGTDFYEVWQLQQGYIPGVDFIAEQQPLFLLIGKIIMANVEYPVPHLRLLAGIQVLVGAVILSSVVRKVWGNVVSVITFGIILSSGMVFEQARLFRPDPMMFGWEMVGLACALMAISQNRRLWWLISGFCYAVSILWKPFGIFPVVGLIFYFLFNLWQKPTKRYETILEGIIFAVPFLVVGLGISTLLYSQLGFYYAEAFGQHLSMGQDHSLLKQLGRLFLIYGYFFLANLVFILLVPLIWLNSKIRKQRKPEVDLLIAQFASPLVFLAMTRPLHLRYLFFLVPPVAILLAEQFQIAFVRIGRENFDVSKYIPYVSISIILFGILTTFPRVPTLLIRQEIDTIALSKLVADNTGRYDLVLSDYAGINYFAKRQSIYEASIIAGGQIDNAVVTTDLLIDRIDGEEVTMVLVHIEGGDPPPHQLVNLAGYEKFRAFLQEEFSLLTIFDRADQQIEVYTR